MKKIGILLNVRKNSSRCNNKLLKEFAHNCCLFEIALKKLEKIVANEKYLAAYEDDFFSFEHNESIKDYRRSEESAHVDGPLSKVFECFNVMESEYVMFFNPCLAFLKIETIQSAIDFFKNNDYNSLTSVEILRDWIFNSEGELIYPTNIAHGDTKKTEKSFRVAHAFHIFSRKDFLKKRGYPWSCNKDDPYLFEISKTEAIDIDYEEEFLLSSILYEKLFPN
ncbi:MAG TPA: hypothetical protein VMZ91_10455 [Candidatus Paceibacterota bacterium]|nr:hypothetical protein [Candidatus Paceibacterota bacterium]